MIKSMCFKLDVKVEEADVLLINLYIPNTETEQGAALLDLAKMLETIKDLYDRLLAGNFDFFFDISLDSY